ncbi:PilX N-terminal domain-containing pilus assembly protein [Haliea sp.]
MVRHGFQRGVALVVSLLFLLVVTIVSITAATNSSLGLRMAGNLQDNYESFQAAEAGIYGALALAGTAEDPFLRVDDATPFAGLNATTTHPLRSLRDGVGAVDVRVTVVALSRDCPRPPGEEGGSSIGIFDCDFYRVRSEHDVAGKARSRIELGVVKTVVGEAG